MNIVICGSRNFENYELFKKEVDSVIFYAPESTIISGGAKGADTLAYRYAECHGLRFEEFLADWNTHGKKAGMLRNNKMLDVADMVIAFWDGESVGTGHMVREAKRRKIPILVVDI